MKSKVLAALLTVLLASTASFGRGFGNGPMMCTLDVKNKMTFKNRMLVEQGPLSETTQENHGQTVEVNCRVSGWRPVTYEVQCFFLAADNASKHILIYDFDSACKTSNVPERLYFQSDLLMGSVTRTRYTPWVVNEYDENGALVGIRTGTDVSSRRQKMLTSRGCIVRVLVDGRVVKTASNSTQPLPDAALDAWLKAQKKAP
jgi:hypothetical protein